MPFTPSSPIVGTSWTAENTSGGAVGWTGDAITEVYDLLVDIDGNYIVDNAGNFISLGGGIVADNPTVSGTIVADTAIVPTAWTPEG